MYPIKGQIVHWETISNDKIKGGLFLLYFILSLFFCIVCFCKIVASYEKETCMTVKYNYR